MGPEDAGRSRLVPIRGPEREARLAEALERVRRIHAEVDRRAGELARRHGSRLRCGRGCCACCTDGLTVFEVEAERIRRAHAALLREAAPHPPGACAFLGPEGECRIYPERPYVCRTQGLPLRWLEPDASGATRELRDICPKNAEGEPLESLPASQCWTIGPVEAALADLQGELDGGELRRVALRALFAAGRGGPARDSEPS